MKKHNYNYKM